ncbi:hypothetical protein ACFQXA_09740 [Nocardiopsis composta]
MNVSGAPAHLIQPVVTAVVTPATVVAAMFFLEWRVAAAALATAPLLWGAFRLSAHLSQRTDARVHDSAAETSDRVVEFAGAQGCCAPSAPPSAGTPCSTTRCCASAPPSGARCCSACPRCCSTPGSPSSPSPWCW